MSPARTAPVDEYRRLVHELAGNTQLRERRLAAAEQTYVDTRASLHAEVRTATRDARRAARAAAEAADAVLRCDADAAHLWRQIRAQGRWSGRPGGLPDPSDLRLPPGEPLTEVSEVNLLDRAAAAVARARRGAPLPRLVLPLLPLLGAAVAAVVALVATGFAVVGAGAWSLAGHALLLLAPFAGLPAAAAWARRRFNARLDTGAVALTVLGGMIACTALVIWLR